MSLNSLKKRLNDLSIQQSHKPKPLAIAEIHEDESEPIKVKWCGKTWTFKSEEEYHSFIEENDLRSCEPDEFRIMEIHFMNPNQNQ